MRRIALAAVAAFALAGTAVAEPSVCEVRNGSLAGPATELICGDAELTAADEALFLTVFSVYQRAHADLWERLSVALTADLEARTACLASRPCVVEWYKDMLRKWIAIAKTLGQRDA